VRIKHNKVPIKTICSFAAHTVLIKQGHPSRCLMLFSSLRLGFLRFETATANVKELHGISRSIESNDESIASENLNLGTRFRVKD